MIENYQDMHRFDGCYLDVELYAIDAFFLVEVDN